METSPRILADLQRRETLQSLRAFGLYVKGMNAREIAELFESQQNVRYWPADIYRMVWAAWRLVRKACPSRWPRRITQRSGLGWLKGHRDVPKPEPPPPAIPPMRPVDRLCADLAHLEQQAREDKLHTEADGIRNLRAAIGYNARVREEAKAK